MDGNSDTNQTEILNSLTFLDFKSASNEVLKFLKKRIGFNLWMLTRTEGQDWIVLQSEDTGYGIEAPTVLHWADSFCIQMVQGKGPQIAPSSDLVKAYAAAPIGKQLSIGAYIGVPLLKNDGSLFGTLCAIHPEPQPESIKEELPLIRLFSQLLSGLLNAEQEVNKQIRLTERAETESLNDPLTGCYNSVTDLYNLNGWWQLLDAEELRCENYGSPAWVFFIEINSDSSLKTQTKPSEDDDLLLQISRALFESTHPEDIIAQIDVQKFAILAVESTADNAKELLNRLKSTFKNMGILISVGYAGRNPTKGLREAWKEAEKALYKEKNKEDL